MSRSIHVHLLPALVPSESLAGQTVLVIDLLRASTTISYALANGAADVVPFVEVEEVRHAAAKARQRGEEILCGGERGGQRIEGFDLGNSPRDYLPDVVNGKRVFFTTTNGTRALHHAAGASQAFVACLANLTAVSAVVINHREVHILCAGSDGEVTREDVIAAGAYVEMLNQGGDHQMNDSALLALDAWRQAIGPCKAGTREAVAHVAKSLADGQHGEHLISLGYGADLVLCATTDSLDVVPAFDEASGSIRAL